MLATPKLGGFGQKSATQARPVKPLHQRTFQLSLRLSAGGMVLFAALVGRTTPAVSPHDQLRQRTEKEYTEARKEFHRTPESTAAALRFGLAAFEWAELNSEARARIANEGITACRAALVTSPESGRASYFLALNLGQLARTKKLGALKLVSEMETAFLSAIAREPEIHFGGPHRSLGLLYAQAPGWPLSVGSRTKARKHLEKAVTLVPDYPGNQLALLEAYLGWGKKELARERFEAAKRSIEKARSRLVGERWVVDWEEWGQRWKAVEAALRE